VERKRVADDVEKMRRRVDMMRGRDGGREGDG
jgi:hypothetical protein